LLGAIVAFRRTVEIDENDADAWADLGRCLASLRRFREASEAWARVAALDPGKVPSEADEIREAGCHPSPIDLCSRLAYARMRAGDNAGAASAFDEALAHDPGQVDLWCDRGICEELINGSEQALVYFERALECDGTSIRVWYNRGVSLQRLSRHEDAVRSFGRSIALHRERELPLDPDRLHAHHNLGLCLLEMGRRESALDQFDEVARCARSQPDRWAAEARLAERLKLTLFGV
jgi:tetratricopeptide (TPR) repeat protein